MKKIVVGMSGGVDSSVAAILLKKMGYEVIGITFKFIDDFDATDAILVSKKIGIEHHVIDYRKEFKENVIDRFINDYKKGITPNPCVICNRYVKLKFLHDMMIKYNCDYMSTGHYAKIIDGNIYKSADQNKDQTYFLCEVKKEIISKLVLPLENISKDEVRNIAREYGLDNADKKDSTDVCFINSNFKEYMQSNLDDNIGDIIDIVSGKIIGKHNGLSFYTIGQRRGLNVGGTIDRLYVVGKDFDKNILYVSVGSDTKYLLSDSCIIENVNWIYEEKVSECTAKFRYRSSEEKVNLEFIDENTILVRYNDIKSVTPGQICALYKDNICVGGGVIKEVRKNNEKLWYL